MNSSTTDVYPAVMKSWRTTRPCCTCPLPLRSKTLRKTPLAPHLMHLVRPLAQRTHQPEATRSRGSLHLKEARPRRRLAPPPSNCRGCPVTVSGAHRQIDLQEPASGSALDVGNRFVLCDECSAEPQIAPVMKENLTHPVFLFRGAPPAGRER